MFGGLLTIAVGVYFFLVGLGKVRVSKNAEANAAFLQRWSLSFCIVGPIVVLTGLARLFWRTK
jgi:hypothetical protein